MDTSIIICPNCQSLLNKADKILECPNGHAFDIAKGGHINLLLPNQKKTLDPGDNKIMMNARQAFLSTGHYDFLIDFMGDYVTSLDVFSDASNETSYLLDLGCGTGYYTRNLLRDQRINKVGIDISKAGISKAAKSDKSSTYIVSSIFNLPIADSSVDIGINIFSPLSIDEVNRVLKPGGYFIKVIPAENHMKEVAALIYESIIPHASSIEKDLSTHPDFPDLDIVKVETLKKEILVRGKNLYNLIAMTPYFYKFEEEALEKLKELSVTISFKIIIAQYLGD